MNQKTLKLLRLIGIGVVLIGAILVFTVDRLTENWLMVAILLTGFGAVLISQEMLKRDTKS